MLNRIITLSLRHRALVLLAWLAIATFGVLSLLRLPIDAFPDTTPVQVQVNTVAESLSPEEVEQQITIPLESAIAGLPRLDNVRSISKFGLSQITATFHDGTDIYLARQVVAERMNTVELPESIERPELGPVATGLGEVFHYIVTGAGDNPPGLAELTTIHDWVIKPQLRSVPGVAEVNTWGGQHRQFHVLPDPERLIRYDLTLDDVADALRHNNISVGGGYISRAGEATLVHGLALTTDTAQIADIVIQSRDGSPIRIRDVAEVQEGHEIRRAAATANGRGEVVLGLGFMLMGENSHEVTRRLEQRLDEIRPTLPPGVDVRIVYERTTLVDRVIHTVKENLYLGALLVVAVLFAFLGSLRAGLIVAIAIPLAMLCSFSSMLQFGIAASLLSLGAIDFGLVVDSSVIVVENSVRRLAAEGERREKGEERITTGRRRPFSLLSSLFSLFSSPPEAARRLAIIRDAAIEVRRPTMFGELIIMSVYIPILLLEGVEGRLFRPMALTVIFALLGSLLFSITLAPVLCSYLLPRTVRERDNLLVRALQRLYRPFIRFSLDHPRPVILAGIALIASGVYFARGLGASFIPRLYEGSLVANSIRLAGVSLDESVRYGAQLERLLLGKFPDEIDQIWSRTGTPEVATDPMGLEVTDIFITLRPRAQWTAAATQAQLTEQMAAALAVMPGMRTVFTQPIEMRMNEMTAGIRADLGVKIFGDDLAQLRESAAQVHGILESIPGSSDIATEQVTGQPILRIAIDQETISRYGIPAAHILEIVQAIGQIKVGEVRQGQRRFDLVIKLPESYRADTSSVGQILIPTSTGERIPLSRLATITETEGPSTITREWGKRRIVVQANARGRDLAGFVNEVRARLAEDVPLPPGYFFRFAGQFEHLQRASLRLAIIIPIVIVIIFTLLYFSTGSVRDSLIVLTGVPFAALGGILALRLRGMDFTISAAIGFIAVSGVAMLSGLVLVSTIKQRIAAGMDVREAIEQTRLIRLRPILMTALVAALGFIPMALNTGLGAEVQRPLATVVIGGILADNLLTLLVLPALYLLFGSRPRPAPANSKPPPGPTTIASNERAPAGESLVSVP